MAELALEGRSIHWLILQGDTRLVILDSPSQTIPLPADNYRIQGICLQPAPDKPVLIGTLGSSRFAAAPGTPYRLKVGAPFVSSVAASRKGNVLQLQYLLKGAAGEEYAIINPDRRNLPRFVIYKGDRQVASDSFKFG